MATESIYPSAPNYLLHRALLVIKKPKSRKNRSLIQDNKSDLIHLLKAKAEEIKETKRISEKNREDFAKQHAPVHSHLTEAERKSRRKERNQRIKMFQLKLKGKRITNASSFALMSEDANRRLTAIAGSKKGPNKYKEHYTYENHAEGIRPSEMTIDENDENIEEEEEDEDEEDEDDVEDGDMFDENQEDEEIYAVDRSIKSHQIQILSEIASQGIMNKNSLPSVSLIGEKSFVEQGLHLQFEPKKEMSPEDVAKFYEELIEKVNKDLNDQIVTQLTVKMGHESVSVVVYWQPLEDRLKIKVYCFHR
jgi:hypothetical protein